MSGRGGYVGGEDWESDPEPLPVPSSRRLTRDVLCCPKCQSLDIGRRDNGKAETIIRWECRSCEEAWHEPSTLTLVRAWVLP